MSAQHEKPQNGQELEAGGPIGRQLSIQLTSEQFEYVSVSLIYFLALTVICRKLYLTPVRLDAI